MPSLMDAFNPAKKAPWIQRRVWDGKDGAQILLHLDFTAFFFTLSAPQAKHESKGAVEMMELERKRHPGGLQIRHP